MEKVVLVSKHKKQIILTSERRVEYPFAGQNTQQMMWFVPSNLGSVGNLTKALDRSTTLPP